MGKVKLVVVYEGRTISIPFKNVALIDEFTTYYDNLDDIGLVLNEILDLRLNNVSIKNAYIIQTTQKDELSREYTEYLPIRYSFDNFDYDSVMKNYIEYLLRNEYLLHEKNTPLSKITDNYMRKYSKIYLNESDIQKIGMLYLNNSSGTYSYDRFRLAYFTLLRNGYKVEMQLKPEVGNLVDRTDLTKYNPKDEFFEYLIKYSKIGDDEKTYAMDILASESIDDMEKNMYNRDYGLFDNKHINFKRDFGDDALLLQALTNMTIQELIDVINNYQNMTKEKNKAKGKSK